MFMYMSYTLQQDVLPSHPPTHTKRNTHTHQNTLTHPQTHPPTAPPSGLWPKIKSWIERVFASSSSPSDGSPPAGTPPAPPGPQTPLDMAREATGVAHRAHAAAESTLRGLEQQRDTLDGKIKGDYGPDQAFVALHDRYGVCGVQ